MSSPGRGGYRQPANPAPVSGPGQLSRRTDGGPGQPIRVAPGGDYGTRDDLIAQQKAAPMGNAGAVSQSEAQTAPALSGYTGGEFGAASARPGEPVTAGVDMGAGPGSEILGSPAASPNSGAMTALLQRIQAQGGGNAALATLLQNAMSQGD